MLRCMTLRYAMLCYPTICHAMISYVHAGRHARTCARMYPCIHASTYQRVRARARARMHARTRVYVSARAGPNSGVQEANNKMTTMI